MTTPGIRRTYALLTDGSTAEIAPAGPGDARAVRDMHAAMSPENAYRRFFSLSKQAPEQEAQRVCREPGPDHAALLAWLDGRLVGVASYEPGGSQAAAEIAFAVADDMHGRGVATLLLEHLVSLAAGRGLQAFTAQTLPENWPMLHMFAAAGLAAERHFADGLVELRFPLPGTGDAQHLDSYLDTVAGRASRAEVASLRHLLQPASVAVVVAGGKRGTAGRQILRNIVSGGFAGRVYPVSPGGRPVGGRSCLASVTDLPDGVDLAVIALPAADVTAAAAQCGRRGVRALVVTTPGLGPAGAELLAICRSHGMRLVGPDSSGVAVPGLGLDATSGAARPAPGRAGLVVQSGGIGSALLEQVSRLGIGVSSFASVGDKYDVSSNDMLMWWEQDQQTRLAVLYVESFGNPREFARTARRVGQRIPVLTVIGGRPAAGQPAAAGHSSAAAPLVTREALFAQAGIIATHGLGELVEAAALLSSQDLPDGDRIAIVSNSAGAGVLAADACGDNGLRVAVLAAATQRRLTRLLPAGAAVAGPVDTGAAVSAETFRACLQEAAADEGVDAVLAVAAPAAVSDLSAAICGAGVRKPLAAALLSQAEAVRIVRSPADSPAGLPAYAYPEGAARALAHAVRYRGWRKRQLGTVPVLSGIRTADARALTAAFLARWPAGGWLPAGDAAGLLACYQIPLVPARTVADGQAAVAAAAELGGAVVLKAEADGLVRGSRAGAVKLDLRTGQEVAGAYRQLAATFGAGLRRVRVQPMLAGGVEVLVGVVQEPVFGPLVVFGLAGAAEVAGDRAARLTPLTDADADQILSGGRAAPLLFGRRGGAALDTAGLAGILLRVSRLADDLPEVAELDLRPVIARHDGVRAADVRIRLTPAARKDPFLRRLR